MTICLYVPTPRDKAFSLINFFVLLDQLTFNYFKMHLLNNQLCLYLILCLCKQIYAICTPRTELVHRTCRLWSSFSIVRIQNKSLHREIYTIYFWCIVFQIIFQVLQTFVCPEISSFVIYYSNKALSNQRPFHKSVENPRDHAEQGIFVQLTDVLSRTSSRVTSVHRLY